mmetsp:Transcript_4887/g.4136  ORF Transcript_4887/g.4136 Transcript_4887/m.4136 type:complete len:364 (+) Transcript_4887:955-2046(+)
MTRKNKIKKPSFIVLANLTLSLVGMLIVGIYFRSHHQWREAFACWIISLCLGCYHYIRFPYMNKSTNYAHISLYISVSFGFFRTFLVNVSDNKELRYISSYGIILTPLVFVGAYIFAVKKGAKLDINEPKDSNIIEKEFKRLPYGYKKTLNNMVDIIQEFKLKGVKVQYLNIVGSKDNKLKCEAVFQVDNGLGLFFLQILCSKLWSKHQTTFSKISIINMSFYIRHLQIVQREYMLIFQYALMSEIFRNLTHLELHNFCFMKNDFEFLVKVLATHFPLKVLDLHHNEIIEPGDDFFNIQSLAFVSTLLERCEKHNEIFMLKPETIEQVYKELEINDEFEKLIVTLNKKMTIEESINLAAKRLR